MIQNSLVRLEPLEVAVIYVMLLISLIPIFAVSKTNSITERIAYASSFGNKLAFMIVAFGIFRGDWMIGCIGAFILIIGDAGMLILSLLEMRI
jgi:multicomponent Na+:H+ antiporter subunit F|tara:strand:+ start:125 stop:403 length:279 start_codon:yes stop_codon:yes gene_type:complete